MVDIKKLKRAIASGEEVSGVRALACFDGAYQSGEPSMGSGVVLVSVHVFRTPLRGLEEGNPD